MTPKLEQIERIFLNYVPFIVKILFIYLLIFQREGKGGRKKGEKHHVGTPLFGDLARNPGTPTSNPTGNPDPQSPTSHQPGLPCILTRCLPNWKELLWSIIKDLEA